MTKVTSLTPRLFIWWIFNSISKRACAAGLLREVVMPINDHAQSGVNFPLAWFRKCLKCILWNSQKRNKEFEAWILPAESSQWIQISHDSGPAIMVVESFCSKCSSNYNTTNIVGGTCQRPSTFCFPCDLLSGPKLRVFLPMEISPGVLAQSQQLFLARFGKLVNLNDPVTFLVCQ